MPTLQPGPDWDTLATNVCLLHELRPVLAHLEARRIRPVALKGLALLHSVYADDLGARSMVDVDLLIEPGELDLVSTCLKELGYAQTPTSGQINFEMWRGRTLIRIDLHMDLWHLDDPQLRDFRSRCTEVDFDGVPLWIPAIEDHMVLLSVHAVIDHGQLRPTWLEDLRRLAARNVDWKQVVVLTGETGTALPTRLALARAGVPVDVHEQLALSRSERWIAPIIQRVLGRPEVPDIGLGLRLLCARGFRAKLGALIRQLCPGDSFLRRRYGATRSSALLFQRLARPFRTLARGVRLGLRLAGAGATPTVYSVRSSSRRVEASS